MLSISNFFIQICLYPFNHSFPKVRLNCLIKKEYFFSNISNFRKIDRVTYKPQILETFENVRNFSFKDKKEAVMDETKMNKFLDRIIGFKKSLNIKTEEIEDIVESSEKIIWFNHLDDDSLRTDIPG